MAGIVASFLFELVVDGGPVELRLHPIEIREAAVHRADSAEVDWWHERIRRLSGPFGTRSDVDGVLVPTLDGG